MRTNLTAVEQIEFDSLVHIEYRSEGFLLRDAVKYRDNIVGASVQFRRVGEVISVPTGFGQAVTPQDPGYRPVVAHLVKHTTPISTDSVEELVVNFDVMQENAQLIAYAMGRRSDQIIINALDAGAPAPILAGGSNFDYAKYTQIIEYFENNGVPLRDRFVAMSANNFRALLMASQFTSSFFTQNRVLDSGMVRDYLGINVKIIPEMTEGGLPKLGNIRTIFAWHKQAIGMASGMNFRAEINYIPQNTSWLANGIFFSGAVVIDPRGVIAVEADESIMPVPAP